MRVVSSKENKSVGEQLSNAADILGELEINRNELLSATMPQVKTLEDALKLKGQSRRPSDERLDEIVCAIKGLQELVPQDLTTAQLGRYLNRLRTVIKASHELLGELERQTPRVQRDLLDCAEAIIKTYSFNRVTGMSQFSIPAGVSDERVFKAANEYLRKYRRNSPLILDDRWIDDYTALPKQFPAHCKERDYSQGRTVIIRAIVEDTRGQPYHRQRTVLGQQSLTFSDPRDQRITAMIHACAHKGDDLFSGFAVCGSIPGILNRFDGGDSPIVTFKEYKRQLLHEANAHLDEGFSWPETRWSYVEIKPLKYIVASGAPCR